MNYTFPAVLLLALWASPTMAAVAHYDAGTGSSANIAVNDGKQVATIRGRGGIVVLNGDTLELKDSIIYINGKSYGKVPKGSEVKYVVSGDDRTLYVDGKPRKAPQ